MNNNIIYNIKSNNVEINNIKNHTSISIENYVLHIPINQIIFDYLTLKEQLNLIIFNLKYCLEYRNLSNHKKAVFLLDKGATFSQVASMLLVIPVSLS